MERKRLIYLDHAATTFPKPRAVTEEVLRCLTQYGGNPGRGSHALSLAAAEKIFDCRCLAARFFGVSDPERVFFTVNTTQGLNTVLKGLLRTGDHVLISDLEHNAVYRPLYQMEKQGRITFDTFPSMTGDCRKNAMRICAGIARRLRPETTMVVCTHVSNLCSAMLPVREIGRFCHRHGLLFVVDGAQSAGHVPIFVDEMEIDALCVPGHKGLYGPQGCGMVILGKGILPEALMEGGNGVNSLEGEMPDFSPERYEAGTLPTVAIAGLCEGIRAVESIGTETIFEHEKALYRRTEELLSEKKGLTLYASEYEGAALLLNVDGLTSEQVGSLLNEDGICVRSGFHCSALGHRTLGTPSHGAVRVSFGMYNDMQDVEYLCQSLERIRKEYGGV